MKPSVLYIAGTGRSGSTLLAGLLGGLERHVAVGELRYVWVRGLVEDQLCECGARFRSCPFWTEVFGQAFGGMDSARPQDVVRLGRRVDRIRHIPRLAVPALRPAGFQADLDELGETLRRLYAAILTVAGASVVVDSSKDPSYAYLLCACPSLDVTLVHLVRDSRAVAYSWTREKVRPEIHWKVEHMRRRPPSLTARRWVQYHLMLELLERRRPRSLRIRYEDLAADAEGVVGRVAELTSARPTSPATPHPTPGHSVAGNPMRFAGPQPIRPDLAWVDEMAADDRRLVTAVTAPLLARYGYLSWQEGFARFLARSHLWRNRPTENNDRGTTGPTPRESGRTFADTTMGRRR